jgi:hypothetical protein
VGDISAITDEKGKPKGEKQVHRKFIISQRVEVSFLKTVHSRQLNQGSENTYN